jgi:hypothetical protein
MFSPFVFAGMLIQNHGRAKGRNVLQRNARLTP